MDWQTLFTMQHTQVHSAALEPPERMQDLILGGLTDEEVRLVPVEGQNSIAWLLWHMTRCEDIGLNVVLSRQDEVYRDGWADKVGIDRIDIGTGMTPPEVSDLSQRVDLEALLAYRLAVARRTREVVAGLDDSWLQTSMTDDEVSALADRGAFGVHAGWVGDLWAPKPRMWFLWLATGHCYSHLGEAMVVRSLAGRPVGK
jgi:hypothetical protein